ncbi:MAG: dipeptide epimerase, partial [Sodaliphilus sp.]|nr:dipeptide epimerase [Sodaliphilus sp.]
MDRRKFILGAGLGIAAAASPISLFGKNEAPAQIKRSGRLKLKFFPYELKLKHAFNLAKYSRTTTPDVQVELEYDGVVGYGECSMPPYLGESVESVCKFLGSLNLEQFTDPFRKEDILAYVESVAPNNRAAKAGVDIALHDLLGKLMGQPWYKIWGLNPEKAPLTTCTIGIDTDEVVRQKMTETYDFKLIKVKMGLGGIEKDKHLYELVRSIRPDIKLYVDANQGWKTKEEALEMAEWLADKDCLFVEQPLEKEKPLDDTAWLTERSPLPIVADEAFQRLPDIRRFHGVYSGINIKLMKSTGMNEAYKMVTLARALDMKIMVGCMTETSCA